MLRICFLCAAVLFQSSCSMFWNSAEPSKIPQTCPFVIIPRDVAYVVQKVNAQDDFQIELKGYEGYCYFNEYDKRRKAVITPQFSVRRLRGRLDETDVHFSFFTETIKGPPAFLGKKSYFEQVEIPLQQKEKTFSGRTVEVSIPNADYGDFPIYLGLDLTAEETKYNNRTFDIKFRYEENY